MNDKNKKKHSFLNSNKRLKNIDESKKYINEMNELEESNEKSTNKIFVGVVGFAAVALIASLAFPLFLTPEPIHDGGIIAVAPSDDDDIEEEIEEIEEEEIIEEETTTPEEEDEVVDSEEDVEDTEDEEEPEVEEEEEEPEVELSLGETIFEYLSDEDNLDASVENAISMNGGSNLGFTPLLIAEILESNDVDIKAKDVINIEILLDTLENDLGWEKVTKYSELEAGDIVFTVSDNNAGIPSHAYFFMEWKGSKKSGEAYIVDGQITLYDSAYHLRNVSQVTTTTSPFDFAIRPSK